MDGWKWLCFVSQLHFTLLLLTSGTDLTQFENKPILLYLIIFKHEKL